MLSTDYDAKYVKCRVFILVFINTSSVKIYQETWKLWSKIKLHVFMAHSV